jgi:hypothetical protein
MDLVSVGSPFDHQTADAVYLLDRVNHLGLSEVSEREITWLPDHGSPRKPICGRCWSGSSITPT